MRRALLVLFTMALFLTMPLAAKVAGPPGIERVITTEIATPIGAVVDVLGNEMYLFYPAIADTEAAVLTAPLFNPSPPTVTEPALRATETKASKLKYLIYFNPRDRLIALARDQSWGSV